MLGWLHSHDERYLSSLTNNRIRNELGASGQVSGWIKELTEAGFIAVERKGQRNRFILLSAPWEALAVRRSKDDEIEGETEPTDNRLVDECTAEPTDYRPVTDRLPAGNQPKNGHIEYQVEDQAEHQLNNVSDIVQEAEIVPECESSFRAWWKQYPRKVGKQKALAVWRKLSEADRLAAADALPAHVEHWRNGKTIVDYIPHPASWLNGRRWEDELVSDYKPAGSLVDAVVEFARQGNRQERHGSTGRNDGARQLGRGDDRVE
jgi:DNA-binding transcriptional ArsR family regulator